MTTVETRRASVLSRKRSWIEWLGSVLAAKGKRAGRVVTDSRVLPDHIKRDVGMIDSGDARKRGW